MNTDRLNADQRSKYNDIRREAVATGKPVADLLILSGLPKEDQAAIADEFVPGAGREYLDA